MFSALTIGTNGVNAPSNYFDGCLDSIAYFGRAKNATEILYAATVVARLSFDGSTLLDSGPLLINGTGTNYSYTPSGRVNAALTLSGLPSYVQVSGLRRWGTNNWPYTVAVWINAANVAGGTIMHLSSQADGRPGWCIPIIGFTSTGQISINSWNGSIVPITGPPVPSSVWTHVASTYSPSNGLRLYVNGTLRGFVGGYNFISSGTPMILTLGNSLLGTTSCVTGGIQMGQYYGSLDELYVYARELTALEISTLANP